MKSLEELKEMRKEWLKGYEDDKEYYELFKSYNFVAYNLKDNKIICSKDYESAKCYAEQGGQVLVLNNDKIYTYKVKNDKEYEEYLTNEIRNQRYSTMNRYGL